MIRKTVVTQLRNMVLFMGRSFLAYGFCIVTMQGNKRYHLISTKPRFYTQTEKKTVSLVFLYFHNQRDERTKSYF